MKMREEDPEVKEPPKQEEREKLTHEEIIREVLGRC